MAADHDVANVDPYATAEPEATTPVFKRLCAPSGLATKRQLRDMGLRPGGQDPVAEVETRGPKNGLLYEIAKALPVRPMTLDKEAALDKAMAPPCTPPSCAASSRPSATAHQHVAPRRVTAQTAMRYVGAACPERTAKLPR
ncbi:RRQRL motif-containing zinc-binding protein [Streptomyces sp. NPDC005969]|uniref:RRQRL motif-containing zinc-binding protein n=1 Tax=Streptomyces sp. NPDC005969 TaxID=3156722 RepID=UPI0033E3A65A